MNLVRQSQSFCSSDPGPYPTQAFHHLDALWVQVAGTRCNLRCAHCFVSAGPDGQRPMMARADVRRLVQDALSHGVKEFYFTGGEPFLHPEMMEILEETIAHGPCSVLTHGLLLTADRLRRLEALSEAARYSLELRVSLDGRDAEQHERVRGAGSFSRLMAALRACAGHGLLPIVTVTHDAYQDPLAVVEDALALLRAEGISRPRVKALPLFRLGREVERSGSAGPAETLEGMPSAWFQDDRLQCARVRAVASDGVYVCPLLVEEPSARLGERLGDALVPVRLAHAACHTCHLTGMTCGNA